MKLYHKDQNKRMKQFHLDQDVLLSFLDFFITAHNIIILVLANIEKIIRNK